ncbi:hypothetical protein A2U01_0069871, partial [Trifolium medium]|nr:hypothetical protein [Trifolium medium]
MSLNQKSGGSNRPVVTNLSKNYAGNTVDNPIKEACKTVGERAEKIEDSKRGKNENELRQFQKWFNQLGMT